LGGLPRRRGACSGVIKALERMGSGTSGVLAQPVAGAFDLDDDGVMQEPIEERRGDHGIAEHLAPLGEAPLGGQDHRAAFVAGVDSWKTARGPLTSRNPRFAAAAQSPES
jgi:hypothetical protein